MLEEREDHVIDSLRLDQVRLFETPILLNSCTIQRILLTRSDVLHSMGIPSMGMKLDAIPGRINSTILDISVKGLFVGSCYELCGNGHRVMPLYVLANCGGVYNLIFISLKIIRQVFKWSNVNSRTRDFILGVSIIGKS